MNHPETQTPATEGDRQPPKDNYISRQLRSAKLVAGAAKAALDFAERMELTQEEAERIPGTIERILKEERYSKGEKYKRPTSGQDGGSETQTPATEGDRQPVQETNRTESCEKCQFNNVCSSIWNRETPEPQKIELPPCFMAGRELQDQAHRDLVDEITARIECEKEKAFANGAFALMALCSVITLIITIIGTPK